VATLKEFWVVASVMLDPSIGPLESLVAATIRATKLDLWAAMFLSLVSPVIALTVNAFKLCRAVRTTKHIRCCGGRGGGRSGAMRLSYGNTKMAVEVV
jgi:hypothetical protein